MSQDTDWFSDLLEPDEVVVATLGGPGPSSPEKAEQVWFQLAWTHRRLLVVRLVGRGGSFRPSRQYGLPRQGLTILRFARTPRSQARLEIQGHGQHVVLLDIDDPSVFPWLEPFLASWGGVVGGGGVLQVAEADPYASEGVTDTNKLLAVVGLGVLLVGGCCGCSGAIWVVRAFVLPWLS